MSKKQNNKTGKVWVDKRYRNKLGQWISLKDQQSVVQFYQKNISEDKRPTDIRAEVKKLDKQNMLKDQVKMMKDQMKKI